MMTTKPKRKAAGAKIGAVDPIFAAIAEHKALSKEDDRLGANCAAARARAEKKYGDPVLEQKPLEWAGWADIRPLYRQWNRADRAARKAGMRMARMKPSTLAAVAAMAEYARRNYTDEDNEDWAAIAFKTVAAALARMSGEAA